jgi:leader peptidase (prepilin peptidase)/N-methyltransferase
MGGNMNFPVQTVIFYIQVILVSPCLGSFLCLCVDRFVRGLSPVSPRSHCPECGYQLSFLDLMPIFGYWILGGRCRKCKSPITMREPIFELAALALALHLLIVFGSSWLFWGMAFFTAVYMFLSGVDVELSILPNLGTLGVFCLAIPFAIFGLGLPWWDSLGGAFAGSGLLWGGSRIFRKMRKAEGFGFGDVKLMLSLGSMVGLKGIPVLLLASSGLAFLLMVIVWFGERRGKFRSLRKEAIPFAPFLCSGWFLTILLQTEHVDILRRFCVWY